ncbi:MAG: hypothetical protein E6G62_06765 [Actinobacteria bacterium]|nr:MAG: hypothetical protein E6G62_06765 [Actinomycetota bacterium]
MGTLPPLAAPRRPRLALRAPHRQAGDGRAVVWGAALAIAAVLCLVTFYAKGGLSLETMTVTEMALTCAAGVAVAAAVLLGPARRRAYGVSVVWSVQPDESWQDAGRMFAYCGVFAAAVTVARIGPRRWPAVIGGVTVAAVIVCAYALLTKIFPGELVPASVYARLDEPYGYWNAIGLTAAMGAICCLWLGARRSGHALLSALAYPAMGLLLLTLLLAYSRGALAALAIGVVLWLCVVPLRLRGAAVLILGALGAGGVAAWAFSTHALSAEGVALGERATAGHRLGAVVVAMVLLLALAGVAIGFFTGRRAPSLATRRRAGALLLALIALAAAGFVGALAHSHRGLTGSVSHAVDAVTNPNAKPPSNTAGRLTAVASVRARYWKEALQIWEAHPVTGAGALGYHTARLRYRTVTIDVHHAHGFVVQTLADLGLVGLLVALALLGCWMAAAGRATHPLNRQWTGWRDVRARAMPRWRRVSVPYTAERIGLLTSTGPGTCRATPSSGCSPRAGWQAAARSSRAAPRAGAIPAATDSGRAGVRRAARSCRDSPRQAACASAWRWRWSSPHCSRRGRSGNHNALKTRASRRSRSWRAPRGEPSPRPRPPSTAIPCRCRRCSRSRRCSRPPVSPCGLGRRCSTRCGCSPPTPKAGCIWGSSKCTAGRARR